MRFKWMGIRKKMPSNLPSPAHRRVITLSFTPQPAHGATVAFHHPTSDVSTHSTLAVFVTTIPIGEKQFHDDNDDDVNDNNHRQHLIIFLFSSLKTTVNTENFPFESKGSIC